METDCGPRIGLEWRYVHGGEDREDELVDGDFLEGHDFAALKILAVFLQLFVLEHQSDWDSVLVLLRR